jgi:hypothetical protein
MTRKLKLKQSNTESTILQKDLFDHRHLTLHLDVPL